MARWGELEQGAPELARASRERLERGVMRVLRRSPDKGASELSRPYP